MLFTFRVYSFEAFQFPILEQSVCGGPERASVFEICTCNKPVIVCRVSMGCGRQWNVSADSVGVLVEIVCA